MADTLLLADANPTMQRVVELTCAEQGLKVVSVSDGQQALDYLVTERPALALISLTLQKLDGFEIAGLVRDRPDLQGIPVLLLAGAFETIDEARVRASGAAGVLVKPFEPGLVIKRVKELLGMSAPGAQGAPGARSEPGTGEAPDEGRGIDWRALHEVAEPSAGTPPVPLPSEPTANEERASAVPPALAPEPLPATYGDMSPPAAVFPAADAFALLWAQEQGEPLPPVSPPPAVELSEQTVDHVAARMTDRLADRVTSDLASRVTDGLAGRLTEDLARRLSADLAPRLAEQIAAHVAERMMQDAFGASLRQTVHDVSERLVREEIARIRTAAKDAAPS
jgi:CheY-like chemotaxis protein